jgi:hypothetical protein
MIIESFYEVQKVVQGAVCCEGKIGDCGGGKSLIIVGLGIERSEGGK